MKKLLVFLFGAFVLSTSVLGQNLIPLSINGGIINTHNGFKAQEGAIVDIQYGQIL